MSKRPVDEEQNGLDSKIAKSESNAPKGDVLFSCDKCKQSSFQSRNKLFKHSKLCTGPIELQKIEDISDAHFNENHDAYIYVTGGRIRGKTLGFVERYSVRRNVWEKCPNMMENRGSHCSAVVNNIVYVIGGGGFHSNLNSNEKLNVETSTWEAVASMPTTRQALVGLAVGTDVYTIGGWIDGALCSKDIEKYDTLNNVWSKLTPMTVGRRLLAATEHNNKIYVFGGNCDDGVWNTNALEIYDIATDSWTEGTSLPVAGQCSAVTVGAFIYVFIHGNYALRYDPATNKYTKLTETLPEKVWFSFDITTCNGMIYLHGGNVAGVWSNVLYRYNPADNKYEKLESMLYERRRCSASVVVL